MLFLICMFLSTQKFNTFPFIQRTEQVLIELDISAIEEYVIIINNIVPEIFWGFLSLSCNLHLPSELSLLTFNKTLFDT